MFKKQKKVLINCSSLHGRIFIKEESVSAHCQFGDLPLVIDYIEEWLKKMNSLNKRSYTKPTATSVTNRFFNAKMI